MSQKSAIVVGGGLIGCSTAYYLTEQGWAVTLLERNQVGAGASSGNCGYICPSHVLPLAAPGAIGQTLRTMLSRDSPIAIRLRPDRGLLTWLAGFAQQCNHSAMLRAARGRQALLGSAMSLYRGLIADGVLDCEWQDHGLLMVYGSESQFAAYAATAEVLKKEFDVTAEPLAGDALTQFEPALRPGLAGGWLYPADAHVRPDLVLTSLREHLNAHGARVVEGISVESLEVRGGRLRRLLTSDGAYSADMVVMAAGAETPIFARSLGCRLPIQPGKGYSLTAPSTPNGPTRPMIFAESHVAVTPLNGSLRIGSTMEFAGYDRSVNPKRIALLRRATEQHLRETPDTEGVEPWVGWRPMVYDGLPCIDHAPAADNVVVAAGNGMIGLATATSTGKLAAELATGATPHIDPAPYSLGRFKR